MQTLEQFKLDGLNPAYFLELKEHAEKHGFDVTYDGHGMISVFHEVNGEPHGIATSSRYGKSLGIAYQYINEALGY